MRATVFVIAEPSTKLNARTMIVIAEYRIKVNQDIQYYCRRTLHTAPPVHVAMDYNIGRTLHTAPHVYVEMDYRIA